MEIIEQGIKDLEIIETKILEYHRLADSFYQVWSRLTRKDPSFDKLRKHLSYGMFLLNKTFGDKPIIKEEKVGQFTYKVVREPYKEDKVYIVPFLLYRLDEDKRSA